jgi:hypothetical protein
MQSKYANNAAYNTALAENGINKRFYYRHTPVIPVLGRLKQDNRKIQRSLGYIARPILKEKKIGQYQHFNEN